MLSDRERAMRDELTDQDFEDYESDEEWEDAVCTCDFDEPENCLAHYPIEDGSEDDDE